MTKYKYAPFGYALVQYWVHIFIFCERTKWSLR